MEASPTVVIKVCYGNMLRRFTAQIVDEELDLSMDGLRGKIISLFGFAPQTELMLTYMDEDGDEVTLVDPNDLHDAVKQGLDPLKINVKLISENDGTQFKQPSGSSPPLRSPPAQQLLQDLHDGATEVLKTMPDPLFEKLLKIATDITSKSSLSAPGLIELVDNLFSEMGFPDLGQLGESKTRVHPNTDSDIPGTKDLELSKGNAIDVKLPSNCREEQLQPETTTKNNKVKPINVTGGRMKTLSSKKFGPRATSAAHGSKNINVGKNDKAKKIGESYPNGKPEFSYAPSLVNQNLSVEKKLGESSKSFKPSSGGNIFPSEKEVNELTDSTVGQNTGSISSDSVKGGCLDSRMRCTDPGALGGFSGAISTKLNSCVVRDLNVIDGTIMAPLTPFTKIWRMRNTGMVVWPHKTVLRWIGGDRFTNHVFVAVDIPAAGLPVGDDLDVAADFVAPEHPGLYTSHWRMVSPSGEMFGQRVWVRIKVDASLKETPPEKICGFDLNLPPLRDPIASTEIINAEAQLIAEDQPKPDNSKMTVDVVNPVVGLQQNNFQKFKSPINNSLLVDIGAPNSVPSAVPSAPYPSRQILCTPQNLAFQEQYMLLAQQSALQRQNAALQLFNAASGGSTTTPSAVPHPSKQIPYPSSQSQYLANLQKSMLAFQQSNAANGGVSVPYPIPSPQSQNIASIQCSTSAPSAILQPSLQIPYSSPQSQYLANLQKSMLAFQQSNAANGGVSVPYHVPSPRPHNIASSQKSTVDLLVNASNGGSVSDPSAGVTVPYSNRQFHYPSPPPQDIASRQKSLVDLLAKSSNGASTPAPSAGGVSVPYPIRQTPYPSLTPQNISTLQKSLVDLHSNASNGGSTSDPSAGVYVPSPQNTTSSQKSRLDIHIPGNTGGCGGSTSAPPASLSVSDTNIHIPDPSAPPAPTSNMRESAVELSGNKEVEEVLLRKLEDMGFKNLDLNKEALMINEYDLEQVVDDFCEVSEWYPILDELKKMGFHDTKLNKMLLEKNNGSIKDVVMELIGEDDL